MAPTRGIKVHYDRAPADPANDLQRSEAKHLAGEPVTATLHRFNCGACGYFFREQDTGFKICEISPTVFLLHSQHSLTGDTMSAVDLHEARWSLTEVWVPAGDF